MKFQMGVAAVLLVVAGECQAWGQFGHVVICEIAYREMTPTAREELNRLLEVHGEYTSFNRACLEADHFPRTRPSAHFVNYSRDVLEVTDGECPTAGNECVWVSRRKTRFSGTEAT